MMTDTYDRDGKPVPEDWWDTKKHGDIYMRARPYSLARRVARTQITDDIEVSTCHLGIDHSYNSGPPLIFETMIFGGQYTQELQRYSSEEAAMRGHLAAVDALREGNVPFVHLTDRAES